MAMRVIFICIFGKIPTVVAMGVDFVGVGYILFCNVMSVSNFHTFQEFLRSISHPKCDPLINLLLRNYHTDQCT